jgi:hypothetical protein
MPPLFPLLRRETIDEENDKIASLKKWGLSAHKLAACETPIVLENLRLNFL